VGHPASSARAMRAVRLARLAELQLRTAVRDMVGTTKAQQPPSGGPPAGPSVLRRAVTSPLTMLLDKTQDGRGLSRLDHYAHSDQPGRGGLPLRRAPTLTGPPAGPAVLRRAVTSPSTMLLDKTKTGEVFHAWTSTPVPISRVAVDRRSSPAGHVFSMMRAPLRRVSFAPG
jgi:hypothetical protein